MGKYKYRRFRRTVALSLSRMILRRSREIDVGDDMQASVSSSKISRTMLCICRQKWFLLHSALVRHFNFECFGEIMALIACTECGHRISSLARFCPKCNHTRSNLTKKAEPLNNDYYSSVATTEELLQHEFKPSIDEMVILEGSTFLIRNIFNVSDCYAYLTSKRYTLCDASGKNIIFQISSNGFASVEDVRHLFLRKIIINTVSGETYQVKCQPHYTWFSALLDPQGHANTARKKNINPSSENTDTIGWYYEDAGVKVGPIPENDMIQLIRNNHTIFRNTNVWNEYLPIWKRADETLLAFYFSDSSAFRVVPTRTKKILRMFSLIAKYL